MSQVLIHSSFVVSRLKRFLAVVLSCLSAGFGATSLADYKSIKVKVDPAKTYPFHQTQNSVTIAADPYETRERVKTAFDVKDLDKLGIIPVNIIVTNDGDGLLSVSGADINLLDHKNRSFEPLPLEEVVHLIVTKGKAPSSRGPGSRSPFPMPRRGGIRGDAFEIETDLSNKALKELRIQPKSTASGFVFFRLPDNQMKLGGYKVYIPEIRNLKTKQNLLFFEIEIR